MPHAFELPRVLRTVVKLMCGERPAAFGRNIIDKLVARGSWRTWGNRFCGLRAGLVPSSATVIGTLNQLAEPPTCLRRIDAIGIGERPLQMINLPTRKIWPADIPRVAFSICRQYERAFARTNQNPYLAHVSLLS